MAKKESDNKKNSGLTVAICVVVIIVLVMLFFVQKDNIVGNLKKTNFFERVGVSTPEFVKNHEISDSKKETETIEIDLMGGETVSIKEEKPSKTVQTTEIEEVPAPPVKEELKKQEQESNLPEKESSKVVVAENQPVKVSTEEPEKKVVTTRTAKICFVTIDSSGSANRKIVTRTMQKSDSPLTDCIRALLAGPLPEEASKNTVSLIPAGTQLIGASVKDGIATLNFNDNFEFNTFGIEGSIAQLMQVVYTATEFSTVNKVQFLIEGEKKDYLGTEGQWIGSPLSRASFN